MSVLVDLQQIVEAGVECSVDRLGGWLGESDLYIIADKVLDSPSS